MESSTWQVVASLAAVVSFLVVVFQMYITLFLKSIRDMMSVKFQASEEDRKAIWKRVNDHRHEVECVDSNCRIKTTGVIIKD